MIDLKAGMISFILFLALCMVQPAAAEEKSGQGEDLLAAINRMETMLLRPCDPVQKLMEEPGLYARDRTKFEGTSAALGALRGKIATAEDDWLNLEMLRSELEG